MATWFVDRSFLLLSSPLRGPLSFSRRGFASQRFRARIEGNTLILLRRESPTKIGSRSTRAFARTDPTMSLIEMRIYVRETHAMARLSLERRPGQLLPFQEAIRARVVGSR